MPEPATTAPNRRVVVLGLGGTIAMTADDTGGVRPTLTADQLVAAVPGLADTGITVDVEDVRRVPGEAFGGGTLAYDKGNDRVSPHIHVSVGLKERSATGHTSHLLSATVQFLTEMLVVEVTAPAMLRVVDPALYDIPLLRLTSEEEE